MQPGHDSSRRDPPPNPEGVRASQPPLPARPSQASRPPQPPPFSKGIGRIFFAIAWVGLQGALIVTADRRPDHAFGFRMFAESSTIKISLFREVVGKGGQRERVHVEDGIWSASDTGGLRRRFAWTDRVRRRELAVFDSELSASYGAEAQLVRLQAALDDVAAHATDDADTRRFLLDVTVRRNGGDPVTHHLASHERTGSGS